MNKSYDGWLYTKYVSDAEAPKGQPDPVAWSLRKAKKILKNIVEARAGLTPKAFERFIMVNGISAAYPKKKATRK